MSTSELVFTGKIVAELCLLFAISLFQIVLSKGKKEKKVLLLIS